MRTLVPALLLFLLALAMPAGSVLAAPITVPTSLNLGDEYRLAFMGGRTFKSLFGTADMYVSDNERLAGEKTALTGRRGSLPPRP